MRTCFVCSDQFSPADEGYDDGVEAENGDRYICGHCAGPAFIQGTTHCDLCLRETGNCGGLVDGVCLACAVRERFKLRMVE